MVLAECLGNNAGVLVSDVGFHHAFVAFHVNSDHLPLSSALQTMYKKTSKQKKVDGKRND